MKKVPFTFLKLFISTFYLSAFTFGGGYVIVSLMKRKFVDEYGWLSENEMLDLTAIAQSAPGPIAVNGAIVLGYQLAGLSGVMIATIATILPPFVIISFISFVYSWFENNPIIALLLQGMQAGVCALIVVVSVQMLVGLIKQRNVFLNVIFVIALIASVFLKVNVIVIIFSAIVLALLDYCYKRKVT